MLRPDRRRDRQSTGSVGSAAPALGRCLAAGQPCRGRGRVRRPAGLLRPARVLAALGGPLLLVKAARAATRRQGGSEEDLAPFDDRARVLSDLTRPRGPLVPRQRGLPDVLAPPPDPARPEVSRGLVQMAAGLAEIQGLLDGSRLPMAGASWNAREVLRSRVAGALRPSSPWFRYGIQRAVGVGVAMAVVPVLNLGARNELWVLIAALGVLQPHYRGTVIQALVRTAACVVGILLAIVVHAGLPDDILYPWLAGLLILLGLSYLARNPLIYVVLSTVGTVLIIGVPTQAVLGWGGLRPLDVAAGAGWAVLVSKMVLPARPRVDLIAHTITDAADAALAAVSRGPDQPSDWRRDFLSADSALTLALSDARASLGLLDARSALRPPSWSTGRSRPLTTSGPWRYSGSGIPRNRCSRMWRGARLTASRACVRRDDRLGTHRRRYRQRMSVNVEHRGPVTVVSIDRPAVRNAVDRPTAEALAAAFRSVEADPGCRAAVLTGTGGTFCAGADLREIAEGRGNRLQADGDAPMGPSRLPMSVPVIAAIGGYAVAGGLELALWCDIRVVEADAVLGVFCRRVGVPLIDGGTVRLPRLVGLGRALDLILTGRDVRADEALRIGLADRVVPSGQALEAAVELAAHIAAQPQAALRADRASLYAGLDLPAAEAMAVEFAGGMAASPEAVAGARRFAAPMSGHPSESRE